MAYPGDFVAANRIARTDAQHAAIRLSRRKRRRTPDLRRACFRLLEWLIKRTPPQFTHATPTGSSAAQLSADSNLPQNRYHSDPVRDCQ
jgi:hypothetical protein